MIEYNKEGRKLPKGVYATPSGKFSVKVWPEEYKHVNLGTYDTIEEATFVRSKAIDKHHWVGLKPEEGKYGFIYSVVDKREKTIYIGRKVYKGYNKWSEKRGLESYWEHYTTGSTMVQEVYKERPWDLEFKILMNVESNDEASYCEWELIRYLLGKKLPTGEPMTMNRMLPKLFYRGLEEAQAATIDRINTVVKGLKL